MKKWRKLNPMTDEQRKKDNCKSYANTYLKRGKILKLPCKICSSKKSEMHHIDYNKPLIIIWLCRRCHLLHHKLQQIVERETF